jgi:hypothetical protein
MHITQILRRYVLSFYHPEHLLQRTFMLLAQLYVAQSDAPGLQFTLSVAESIH